MSETRVTAPEAMMAPARRSDSAGRKDASSAKGAARRPVRRVAARGATIVRWLWLVVVLAPLACAADTAPATPFGAPVVHVCPPCPHVADLLLSAHHDGPGTCPVCGMQLVELPVALDPARPELRVGPGAFTLAVGDGTREIAVYYYRPRSLDARSRVLIVLPGAGRNAWEYRDHWVDVAERHGVLVLSPHYPESLFPDFWSYNLGGTIDDVVIDREAKAMTGYRIVADRARWTFDDMDRIFALAVRATGLGTQRFDLFGHSAGGQFLHRFALFAGDDTRADRIVAANSGWYTVPDTDARYPYGLADAPLDPARLRAAFARRLVVFLGGVDDANERRGDLVRSPETDVQGAHRLARGRYFHARGAAAAAGMGAPFAWRLRIVAGVGHDAAAMSRAAARYLYGDEPVGH